MGGHIDSPGAQFQYDFQQIMAVKAQNRTAVGVDIADGFQFCRYHIRILQSREQDEAVYFSGFVVFLID